MNIGFLKVASAIPATRIADCTFNVQEIKKQMDEAERQHVSIICFPELCITGYTCADLFSQTLLLEKAQSALAWLLEQNVRSQIVAIVGMPVAMPTALLNTAVVVQGNKILGIVPKTYIPNYKEFYEQRWFASAASVPPTDIRLLGQQVRVDANQLFSVSFVDKNADAIGDFSPIEELRSATFGIELCEDLWSPIPPSSRLCLQGAEVIFNPSASNEVISKHQYLKTLIAQQSARCICGYVYSSCGFGESSQDLVFGGNAFIYENGTLLGHAKRFQLTPQTAIADIDVERLRTERRTNTTFTESLRNTALSSSVHVQDTVQTNSSSAPFHRWINPHPFIPAGRALDERCEEIFSIQVSALAKRTVHTRAKTLVIGVSGGLDSTLALLVCVKTMDKLGRSRKDILGVTMPGFGTTSRTYNNAIALMRSLGVTVREISIRDACVQHFKDIGHNLDNHDVTYENGQARERTQILMDVANQTNGFVVGTGDLSELALGWATYNADHMSNYGVNCSIPKTLVRHLVTWVATTHVDEKSRTTLLDIVQTPISPELIPADECGNIKQKTEDLVGPYELHDFFLYNFLRHGFRPRKIFILATQAFSGQQTYGHGVTEPSEAVGCYPPETIKHWLTVFCRRFFSQQFKRSCLPDGPKVGSVSLSPRGDWRMPSDASSAEWLRECEELNIAEAINP